MATDVSKRQSAAVASTDNSMRKESSTRRRTPGPSGVVGPPMPILISIFIGFTSTNILVSSLIRLGPQYIEPVYGNVLPYWGFFHGTVVSLVLGGVIGFSYWRYILASMDPARRTKSNPLTIDTKTGRAIAMAFDVAAILTALAPPRARYMFRWSDTLGPIWGSLLTQSMLTFPVFLLSGFVVTISAARISYNPQSPIRQTAGFVTFLGAISMLIWIGQRFSSAHRGCHGLLINAGYAMLSSLIIKLLTGHQENIDAVAAAATAAATESKALEDTQTNKSKASDLQVPELRDRQLRKLRFIPSVACIFFALTTFFSEPTCTSSLSARSSANLSTFHTLMRNESITGWVTVSDDTEREMRLLRSGHSLIGGVWKSTDESIFGIFYFADAVRLVRGRKSNPEDKRQKIPMVDGKQPRRISRDLLAGDGTERALQIGLGIGVSAHSLHRQNVRVDVVEIDPAVYDAAVRFFNLPQNLNAVHLMDGRRFIDEAPTETYDYVVHDVFTGGSVPASLFSQSAVTQLRRILKPDGILAMNYVGVPNDKRTLSHVAHTLRTAFPNVRCFAETIDDMDEMVNMMFFASAKPIVFDITQDVLQAIGRSTICARMLNEMQKNELDLVGLMDDPSVRPITDDWNPLPEWQVGTAVKHWYAMRGLFPTAYWLNY
ncbi:hypothetical protein COEREDRAFT_92336 [Coemansia reversa NRRL 1564]|uniref:PABS domain-containing protein n=1 Tax=Coemansia reversa (strain ATCC 12441 / NRRL 1564) TaxID=763665 RepID=A0A2G5BD73_COERN|nr:hypothetical protein COEREDRAFT_92336 [Coemansia reversa NRRL 1564]|eukprot:PIA16953.1 hypothetical protein COEREDRAFT_92336 [Coemansia reversa NRRL 1564]